MKKFFTLILMTAMMPWCASAQNKVLQITGTGAGVNPWDAQCFINLKNVQKGKANVVKFMVKTTAVEDFKIGTESIDDLQTEHKSEWGASAVFNYTDEITLTSEWTEVVVNFPGVTTVTCHSHCTHGDDFNNHKDGDTKHCTAETLENFEYAATAILLNFGKLPVGATICIDDMKVCDAEGKILSTEDFENATVAESDQTKTVYYPGWQNKATFDFVEMTVTGINSVKVESADGEFYSVAGQKVGKNYKGLVIDRATGKKFINR